MPRRRTPALLPPRWKRRKASGLPTVVIGDGTNLIVSDAGFRGIVLRYRARESGRRSQPRHGRRRRGTAGLGGFHHRAWSEGPRNPLRHPRIGRRGDLWQRAAPTGIPSPSGDQCPLLRRQRGARIFDNAQCEFHYRESIFKRRKEWIIFSAELSLDVSDATALREAADGILKVRNEKFPVTMKCAGSIFKNLLLADLPPQVAAAGSRHGRAGGQGAGRMVPGASRRQGHGAAATYTSPTIMPT